MAAAFDVDDPKDVEQHRDLTCTWLCGEDMPQASRGFGLQPTESNLYGLPAPVEHCKDHVNVLLAPMRWRNFHLGRHLVHDPSERKSDAHPRGAGDPSGGSHRSGRMSRGEV